MPLTCLLLCLLLSTRHLAGLNQYGLMRSENVGMIEVQGHHYNDGVIAAVLLALRVIRIFDEAALSVCTNGQVFNNTANVHGGAICVSGDFTKITNTAVTQILCDSHGYCMPCKVRALYTVSETLILSRNK